MASNTFGRVSESIMCPRISTVSENISQISATDVTLPMMAGSTNPQLPAVTAKIARMLATRPEYFVTHPAELKIVQSLSGAELNDLARENEWRVVRRVGGRQIEFYNDASRAYRPI